MKKIVLSTLASGACFFGSSCMDESLSKKNSRNKQTEETRMNETHVEKKILKNGMTVLARRVASIPKVSIQLWYHVGSKDEKTGEKGIAHLIEHMIFKGTKLLSETDINVITHKLSGYCNAFTSYDYTGYLFDFPTQHWHEALPVMADCMQNATFKDEFLNSEMKAVIQELKMNRDDHIRTLVYDMVSSVFPDHPYHYPVIGYKQDLWSVRGADLMSFYRKHYHPNNATLVVVGDIDPEEVFAVAEKYFEPIPALKDYKKEEFYLNKDIVSKSVTIYRDIKQPVVIVAYVIPGTKDKVDHVLDITTMVLSDGKSSRLQKKLVHDLQLVTDLQVSTWRMFDHGLFFMIFEPKDIKDIDRIVALMQEEIDALARDGATPQELEKALKKAKIHHYGLLENIQQQANAIGKNYLATGDENYAFTYLEKPTEQIASDIKALCSVYLRPSVTNKGMVLPLPEREKPEWVKLQKISDQEDNRIMSGRERLLPVEGASYANGLEVKEVSSFVFPQAQEYKLANGLKVMYYNNTNTPKVNIALRFKANNEYDPTELLGIDNFMSLMLTEGTKNYTNAQLAQEIESRGMSINTYPGGISLSALATDLERGLELLKEIITNATFNEKEMEKVRAQILAELKSFWDDPKTFSNQLIKEEVYKSHPYSKNVLGTPESVKKITRKDLQDFYQKYVSPSGATMACVGDFTGYDLPNVIQKHFGSWTGPVVEDITYPTIAPLSKKDIAFAINRDQVVLAYMGLSVNFGHPDYDKYDLFDQIFGAGSMASRLFKLREQTGLFYTISGSLVARADKQPGLVLVKTIVSLDNLKKAEEIIMHTINTVADTITQQELDEARRAILNRLSYKFESNAGIAGTFLFLDRFNLPANYFDTRAQAYSKITLADVKEAVKKVLSGDKLATLRVGRVEKA